MYQTWTHLTTLERKHARPLLKHHLYTFKWGLDRGYVRERETLVSFVSVIGDPSIVKPWNEQQTPQDHEEYPWQQKNKIK